MIQLFPFYCLLKEIRLIFTAFLKERKFEIQILVAVQEKNSPFIFCKKTSLVCAVYYYIICVHPGPVVVLIFLQVNVPLRSL